MLKYMHFEMLVSFRNLLKLIDDGRSGFQCGSPFKEIIKTVKIVKIIIYYLTQDIAVYI